MINRYEKLPLLLDFLNEYNKLFNDLNRKTYHNLQKSKKLSDSFKSKPNDLSKAVHDLKIELYSYKISLEEIIDTIDEFNERINNE